MTGIHVTLHRSSVLMGKARRAARPAHHPICMNREVFRETNFRLPGMHVSDE